MSEPGDVVWADGRTWQRFSGLKWQRKDPESYLISEEWRNEKRWWVRSVLGGIAAQTLANLKQADDFEWLVKDGIPIVLNALAVYHALDSFADFVAKRDADAELTAERDALLSRLAEMTAQRDTLAEQLGAEIGNREAAERQLAKALARSGELAKVTAKCDNFESLYYEAEHRKGELVAERTVLLGALAEMTKARDSAAKGYLEKVSELEDIRAEFYGWSIWKDGEPEPPLAEQVRKLRDAWRDVAKERDQALRGLDDLQRLVAAAEANELVLVHHDWRQAEIDELAEERDQLSQELAQVKWFREQTQRRRDHLSNAHQELRRQFDVAVNDRNILRARCDELERGDRHSYGFKCGQQEERRAVVAWLNKDPQGWARQWSLAGRIERGEHDV